MSISVTFLQTTKNIQTTRNTFLHFYCCHSNIIKTRASIANQNLSNIIKNVGCHNNCVLFFFEIDCNLGTFVDVNPYMPDNTITFPC